MNSMQVKDKLKNIAKAKNINFNVVLKFYVFDRFIVRLSKSKYRDNFIVKGGFLLSTMFGIENRSTMDIDYSITKTKFNKRNILEMIKSIVDIDLNDGINFSIKGIELIREEDKYGGYRVNLLFKFENIKESFKVDIATGDPITPEAIKFHYKSILADEEMKVWAYNLETVLAEKLETILSKGELSSRMKDYYDIYLIYNKNWTEINKEELSFAISRTFENRKFQKDVTEAFNVIKDSLIIKRRWDAYAQKYDYANNIEYDEIIESIEEIISIICILV